MCLAVPGKIIEVRGDPAAGSIGTVDFHGSRLDVSLILVPEAKTGDWVLVHAGFALNTLDEHEALETWKYLQPEDTEELRSGDSPGGTQTG